MLRRMNRTSMELQFALHAAAPADRMLAEDDAVLCGLDSERAQIEELVVQRTQR